MPGEFAPAIGGDFAILGIQTNDDVPTKRGTGVLPENPGLRTAAVPMMT